RHADVVINATPLGRRGEIPMRPGYLPPLGAIVDLVYVAGGTPLVRRARQLGLRCVDGWAVLLAQGAAALKAWPSAPAPRAARRGGVGGPAAWRPSPSRWAGRRSAPGPGGGPASPRCGWRGARSWSRAAGRGSDTGR